MWSVRPLPCRRKCLGAEAHRVRGLRQSLVWSVRQLTPTEVPERRFEHRLMLVRTDGDCIYIYICVHSRDGIECCIFLGLETEQRENLLALCYVFLYLLCCAEQCCMLIICVDRSLISFHCILFLSFVHLYKRVFRQCFIHRHLGARVSHE